MNRIEFIDKWIAGRKSRTATMAELNADLDSVIVEEIKNTPEKLLPHLRIEKLAKDANKEYEKIQNRQKIDLNFRFQAEI